MGRNSYSFRVAGTDRKELISSVDRFVIIFKFQISNQSAGPTAVASLTFKYHDCLETILQHEWSITIYLYHSRWEITLFLKTSKLQEESIWLSCTPFVESKSKILQSHHLATEDKTIVLWPYPSVSVTASTHTKTQLGPCDGRQDDSSLPYPSVSVTASTHTKTQLGSTQTKTAFRSYFGYDTHRKRQPRKYCRSYVLKRRKPSKIR